MAATDWGSYNLPAIWQMLAGENVCDGADRVLAWEGLATAVREQHRRLVKAGEDLAAVWPPESNASAYAFQARIGELAASMQETLTCAEDTRAGLNGIVKALGDAQSTVRDLAAGRAAVSTDWVPRFVDHAEDEYDQRAQQAMRDAEAAIADYSPQIKAPALYTMQTTTSDSTTAYPGDVGSSAGGSGTLTVRATPVPVAVPHDPVLPDPGTGSDGPNPAGDASDQTNGSGRNPVSAIGPTLSGVTASPVSPGLGSQPALSAPGEPASGGGLPSGILGAPGPVGLVPAAGGFGTGLGVPGGRSGSIGGRQAVPVRRALPSGAVIGEGELAGRGPAAQMSPGVAGGRRGRRRDGTTIGMGAEADEQWDTAEGVAPVIATDTTPVRHDPGPGVLGFDR